MAESGGCARDYAEQARKALASELVEIERIAVAEYLIGRDILDYKAFERAVVADFGERFRPYAMTLWQSASTSYNAVVASKPGLLPPIIKKPSDFVPDYHNLDRLSDVDAGKLAVQNLVDMAAEGRLKGFRGDYDVKPLAESDKRAQEIIENEEVFQAISKQFDIPFDDIVNAQRLMMDALIYDQREKSILAEAAQETVNDLKAREAASPGSVTGDLAKAEQDLAELMMQSRMVSGMAQFYTGLSQGNLSAAGRALRMAREVAMLRRTGAAGEAFVALFGNASMKQPVKLGMTNAEALKAASDITPEKAQEIVEKARSAKLERVEKAATPKKQDNRISGKIGAKDLFGDSMPFAPMTKAEKSQAQKTARNALRKAGVTNIKENTEALGRLAENAKRLKALLGKQEDAC